MERHLLPPAEPADLADAALAKRDGGAGRALRRRMLRALIADRYGLHPAAVRFGRDARGAPGVEGLPVFVSTAGCEHEGEAWSVVALADRPVGVDLEPWADRNETVRDGTVRWTLTEAYLKALGRGLSTAPEDVQLHRDVTRWRLAVRGAPDGHGEVSAVGALAVAVVILPGAPRQGEEGRL